MGTKEMRCYIAVCDDCGDDYEHDYTPHYPSEGEAADDAVNSGDWWSDDETTLLCPSCTHKPHAFVEGVFDGSDCYRCGNPIDEHETAGGEAS